MNLSKIEKLICIRTNNNYYEDGNDLPNELRALFVKEDDYEFNVIDEALSMFVEEGIKELGIMSFPEFMKLNSIESDTLIRVQRKRLAMIEKIKKQAQKDAEEKARAGRPTQ